MRQVPIEKFRDNIGKYLGIASDGEPFELTRRGKVIAVVNPTVGNLNPTVREIDKPEPYGSVIKTKEDAVAFVRKTEGVGAPTVSHHPACKCSRCRENK